MTQQDNGATQVYNELHAVVRRYMVEAPDMTVFQMLGALDCVKADILENLKRHNIEPYVGD